MRLNLTYAAHLAATVAPGCSLGASGMAANFFCRLPVPLPGGITDEHVGPLRI